MADIRARLLGLRVLPQSAACSSEPRDRENALRAERELEEQRLIGEAAFHEVDIDEYKAQLKLRPRYVSTVPGPQAKVIGPDGRPCDRPGWTRFMEEAPITADRLCESPNSGAVVPNTDPDPHLAQNGGPLFLLGGRIPEYVKWDAQQAGIGVDTWLALLKELYPDGVPPILPRDGIPYFGEAQEYVESLPPDEQRMWGLEPYWGGKAIFPKRIRKASQIEGYGRTGGALMLPQEASLAASRDRLRSTSTLSRTTQRRWH